MYHDWLAGHMQQGGSTLPTKKGGNTHTPGMLVVGHESDHTQEMPKSSVTADPRGPRRDSKNKKSWPVAIIGGLKWMSNLKR